jgi:DNA invertase Pin-like site-specific DNA recombinase
MRAAIYLRISQDAAGDGLAIDRQRADCEAIADRNGWTVVRRYSDTLSASKRSTVRPEYEQMKADFLAGEFDALVTWDLDRLTRQPRQLEDWVDLAEDRGLIILTANGEADLSTDAGRRFARIKAAVARQEVERKSARQKAQTAQRHQAGLPRGGAGRFGYLKGNRVADPKTAPLVVWLFEHIAAGGSVNSAAKHLTEVTGTLWRTGRVRLTLQNPAYGGEIPHGIYDYSGKTKRLLRTEVVPAADGVEALVSAELAATVRALLDDPTRRTGPGPAPRHVLSGIAKCGVCGSRMKALDLNYICAESRSHPTMSRRKFERRAAEEVFLWYIAHPTTADDISAGLGTWMGLNAQLQTVTQERDAIQELYLLPGADKVGLTRRLAEVGTQIEDLTHRVTTARAQDARLSLLDSVSAHWDALPYSDSEDIDLTAFVAHWNARPLDERREVLRSLFRVTLDHGDRNQDERARFRPRQVQMLEDFTLTGRARL